MKSYLTAILTLSSLLGFGVSASAQDEAVVSVPFEFVAGGATLSAGRYSVSRLAPTANRGLYLESYNKQGAFVLPLAFDEMASGRQPTLSFEHVGGKYFLSKIETQDGVYTFGIPRATGRVEQVKDQGALSSSGAN
jgi:hypothetical protein